MTRSATGDHRVGGAVRFLGGEVERRLTCVAAGRISVILNWRYFAFPFCLSQLTGIVSAAEHCVILYFNTVSEWY